MTAADRRPDVLLVLFDAVPHYADHGFAVFQLEPGNVTVHPMALTFPTRDEILAPFAGCEFDVRPLWGRTPFNNTPDNPGRAYKYA